MNEIRTVLVCGAGTMGRGIAQICAANAGYRVLLYDTSAAQLDDATREIARNLEQHFVRKGRMNREDADAALERLEPQSTLQLAAEADFVIEAVTEDRELKEALFQELGRLCRPEVCFASNTSVISITALGSASGRPERFCGMHFSSPVPRMPLLEIVRGLRTSDDTMETAKAVAKAVGKDPVICTDSPGFLANRVLIPMYNQAANLVLEGAGTAADVDKALRDACNWPMGPLQVADMAGLDVVLLATEEAYEALGYDPAFRPSPLIKRMVAAGKLGRKTGEGFYRYGAEDRV